MAGEIHYYLSANRPEDDVSTSGGAVDMKMMLMDRDCDELNGGAGDTIDFVSTAAGDNCNVSVGGWQPDGTWATEVVVLNGTNHVQSANTYLHLRKVEMAADAVGVVTVAEFNVGAPIALFTIPIGSRGRAALFLNAAAEAGGGATVDLYEKVFAVNDGDGALSGCKGWMSEDEDAELKWDCELDAGGITVTGGNESVANRLTEPTDGVGAYVWADHATAPAAHDFGDAEDGNLIVNEAQGIFVKCSALAGRGKEQQITYAWDWSAT